jgi:hypothetical protein
MTPQTEVYRERRGRYRSKSNSNYGCLSSIVKIARKHAVDPGELVDAFVEAGATARSHCGRLKIVRRAVDQDSATFLVTRDENVVWQSTIHLESIRNPDLLKSHIQDIPLPQSTDRAQYQTLQQIDNLRCGMKGIDVTAKITEIPPIQPVITRWGSECYVSNVTIADDTGSIRLSLWNNRADKVRVGDEVELTNCYVSRFAGQLQLRLRRQSTMSITNHLQHDLLTQPSL